MKITQNAEAKQRADRLSSALGHLKAEHLECRDYGHPWRVYSCRYVPKYSEYEQTLKCGRCGTERFRSLNSRGQIVSTHYVYADGYLVAGVGMLTSSDRDSIRLANAQGAAPSALKAAPDLPAPRHAADERKARASA